MEPSQSRNPENKRSGVLKTTTWGALVASALLVAGLGLTGHLSPTDGSPQAQQEAANNGPDRSPALAPATAQTHGAVYGRNIFSNPAPLAAHADPRDKNAGVAQPSYVAGGNVLSAMNSVPGQKDQTNPQQDPAAGVGVKRYG